MNTFNSLIEESIYNLYFQENEVLRFCLEYTKCNICLADVNFYIDVLHIPQDFKILFEIVVMEYRNILINKLITKLKIAPVELNDFIEQNYKILNHLDNKRLDFVYLHFLYTCCAKSINEILMQTEAYERNINIYHSYEYFIYISVNAMLFTLPLKFKITSFLLINYLDENEFRLLFTSVLSNNFIDLLLSNHAIQIGKLLPINIVRINKT